MIAMSVEGGTALVLDLKQYPGHVTRAMIRAINRAIASGKTVMVREIARDTGLRATDVRTALPLYEANQHRLEARLATSLKRIPLIKFNARGPEPSRGKGRGVTYRLRGSQGRHPHAFIATMASGHRGVFQRKARTYGAGRYHRLPVQELFGPSLGHVFAKYRAMGLARAQETFAKNFAHELDFASKAARTGTARAGTN